MSGIVEERLHVEGVLPPDQGAFVESGVVWIHASTLVNIACIIDVVGSTPGRRESGRVSFLHFLRADLRRSYSE